jgi:DNA-binding NarL/FixJ family response regulator
MPAPTVNVLVVDDYEPFRRFVHSELEAKLELQIIGQASDGAEALRQLLLIWEQWVIL